ncbi:MAG TPA: hypothetical protein VK090_02235 [Paracoccaceae bacterium]|nr:hypothetical protein [Paracoccaceae bacterium]
MDTLNDELLAAHARKDGEALARLYTQAANRHESAGEIDAACFFLTHAFVFALEAGAPEAQALNIRLASRGRAHRLTF